ncbi:MAG: zf-HC2 domain-containing protein [Planctomycetota bacterium]
MDCRALENLLANLVDETATPAARREAEAHLAACPVCRADARAYRKVVESLRALPRLPAPAGFASRVMSAIDSLESAPKVVPLSKPVRAAAPKAKRHPSNQKIQALRPAEVRNPFRMLMAAAAAVVLCAGVGLWLFGGKGGTERGNQLASVERPADKSSVSANALKAPVVDRNAPAPTQESSALAKGSGTPTADRKSGDAPAVATAPVDKTADLKSGEAPEVADATLRGTADRLLEDAAAPSAYGAKAPAEPAVADADKSKADAMVEADETLAKKEAKEQEGAGNASGEAGLAMKSQASEAPGWTAGAEQRKAAQALTVSPSSSVAEAQEPSGKGGASQGASPEKAPARAHRGRASADRSDAPENAEIASAESPAAPAAPPPATAPSPELARRAADAKADDSGVADARERALGGLKPEGGSQVAKGKASGKKAAPARKPAATWTLTAPEALKDKEADIASAIEAVAKTGGGSAKQDADGFTIQIPKGSQEEVRKALEAQGFADASVAEENAPAPGGDARDGAPPPAGATGGAGGGSGKTPAKKVKGGKKGIPAKDPGAKSPPTGDTVTIKIRISK